MYRKYATVPYWYRTVVYFLFIEKTTSNIQVNGIIRIIYLAGISEITLSDVHLST